MALFKRDFDAFRVNWQNADGAKNKVNSVFSTLTPSANLDQSNSITNVSKDQIQMLRTWNRAVASNCTQQETFNRIIANADDQTKMYFNSLNKGKASIQGLSAAQEVAEQSTIGLTLASTALNAAISIGIGLLIQLAVNGLSKFIHYADDAAEASETAASNIGSFNDSIREQNSTISKLAPEYAELSQGVNALGENVSLTTDEYNRYHEITNQIADMFPTLVQGYDSTGNAILRTKGNLEELNEAYKEAQRQQAWDVISENEEDIVKNANLTLNKNYGLRGTNVVYPNDALDKLLKNATSQDQFGQAASELYQEAMDKQWGFQYNALNEHIKEETGHYLSEFGTLNQEEYNAAIEAMRSYFSKVNAEYESEVAKLQDLAQSYLTLNKDFHNELDATTQNYASQLVGAIDGDTWTKIQESGGNIGDYVNNIVSSLKNDSTFRDAMTDIFSLKDADLPVDEAWQKLNDAIKILADRLQLDENTLKIQLGFEDMDSLKAKYDEAAESAATKFYDSEMERAAELRAEYEAAAEARDRLYGVSKNGISVDENGYVGNVDINNRPVVVNDDGSYSTTSGAFQEKWVGDEETGGYKIIHYTPILPDGTILEGNALNEYIDRILNASDSLKADDPANGGYGIVYKVDTEVNGKKITDNNLEKALGIADAWDVAMHELQSKIYDDEAKIKIDLDFSDKFVENGAEAIKTFFDKASINTEEEIARWNKIAESANTATEAMEKYLQVQINETPYSFLQYTDATDLAERMKYIQEQFESGQITYEDYFSSLQSELDGVDWSTFTDNAEEANEMAQQFFMDTIKTVSKELPDMLSKFENKEIDVTEYINGFVSLAETVNDLTDNLQENSASWNKNGEAISEDVSDNLDKTQESLSGAIEQVSSLTGSIL